MKKLKYFFLVALVSTAMGGLVENSKAADVPNCIKVKYTTDATGSLVTPVDADYTAAGNAPTGTTYTCTAASHPGCPPFVPSIPASTSITYPCSPVTANALLAIMNKVFTTIFVILVTAASFALLYAAFLYVTSEGEQEKVKNAKNIIIYAVVALIIAALAFGAPRAIQSFITG